MTTSSLQDLGIIVADPFIDVCAYDFLVSACPDQKHPVHVYADWICPPDWVHGTESMPLGYGKCEVVDADRTFHLMRFPEAIRRDFSLDDLQFPFKLAGVVLVIHLHKESPWGVKSDQFLESLRADHWGRPGWARAHHLPYVVVLVEAESSLFSTSEKYDLLGIDPRIPMLPYVFQPPILHIEYPYNYTQKVLTTLVEQIEMQ